MFSAAPESAVKFYTYEQAKRWACGNAGEMQIHHRLFAGGVAGLSSQFAIYPMELIKTRLITQSVPKVYKCAVLGFFWFFFPFFPPLRLHRLSTHVASEKTWCSAK